LLDNAIGQVKYFITMTTATQSLEIVERAKGGDQDAFSWLFQKHQSRLAVFIRYQMSDALHRRYEIDDVLQELFLRAFRDLPDYEYQGAGSFMRWLFQIARHTLQDLARHEDRKKREAGQEALSPSLSSQLIAEPAHSRTPSRILFQRERLAQLLKSLDTLAEADRELILLAKVEGLTIGEMSQLLGKGKTQISLSLHRALQRLRDASEVKK
jgi:RNA polymerase sigma-70 factor, ECF subfamily